VLSNKEYYAEGKINEGSYGEIFRVAKNDTRQVYAMKALEKTKLERMKKMHEVIIEIIILKKLAHPGIIRMYNVLERENYIGIVLELCPYNDLFNLMKTISKSIELLKKKKKIMVYYLAQILEAMSYLHSNQIIHRDLKVLNRPLSHRTSSWDRILEYELSTLEPQRFRTQPF
jgi:serine/threonine protein kinase